MFKLVSSLAVLAFVSTPALAQTSPTASTKAPTALVYPDGSVADFSDDSPEAYMRAEEAFRVTVTPSSINTSFYQVQHQCRVWMAKKRITAENIKWLRHERLMLEMMTSIDNVPAAYLGTPVFAINQSNQKRLSAIKATLNCAKMLGLPKVVAKTEG